MSENKKTYEIYMLYDDTLPWVSPCATTDDGITRAIDLCDELIKYKSDGKHSLKEDLNTMQMEHAAALNKGMEDDTVFNNKYTIPLYFINLVLFKYGLEVKEGIC